MSDVSGAITNRDEHVTAEEGRPFPDADSTQSD